MNKLLIKYFYQGYWNNLDKLDEAKAIIDQSIQHSELAIKYDPLNQLAHINLPFAHILKLWIYQILGKYINFLFRVQVVF